MHRVAGGDLRKHDRARRQRTELRGGGGGRHGLRHDRPGRDRDDAVHRPCAYRPRPARPARGRRRSCSSAARWCGRSRPCRRGLPRSRSRWRCRRRQRRSPAWRSGASMRRRRTPRCCKTPPGTPQFGPAASASPVCDPTMGSQVCEDAIKMPRRPREIMIGVDWGTTGFRAFRLRDGQVLDRRDAPRGILAVPPGGFADALQAEVGDWLRDGETHVLLAGMVGSRQGWVEAPYLACPAGLEELASGLMPVPFTNAQVAVIPGLSSRDASGVPEVMRGEETQLIGAFLTAERLTTACLPGTHSKWARLEGGRIVSFTTHMTGEVYAALRGHTILGADDRGGRRGRPGRVPPRRGAGERAGRAAASPVRGAHAFLVRRAVGRGGRVLLVWTVDRA